MSDALAPDSAVGGGIFYNIIIPVAQAQYFLNIYHSLLYVDILIYALTKYYQLMPT